MIELTDYGEDIDLWFERIRSMLPDDFQVMEQPHPNYPWADMVALVHRDGEIHVYSWEPPTDEHDAANPSISGVIDRNTIGNVRAFIMSKMKPLATVPNGGLFTIQDVADRWRVSSDTIRRLIDQGDLQTTRIGKQIRFTHDQLNDYLQYRDKW